MPLWLTDPYVHRCLSSGSLASRKCSGSPGTSVADLAFPPVLLEGLGRVGAHAASERMCNIWKLWVFQPWNSVMLSVHWPQETWKTDRIAFLFLFLFFFFRLNSLTNMFCRQPRALLFFTLQSSVQMWGAGSGHHRFCVFSAPGKKPSIPGSAFTSFQRNSSKALLRVKQRLTRAFY